MKKNILYLGLFTLLLTFSITSCDFQDYLNQSPLSGVQEEEVFSNYSNLKKYFDAVYGGTFAIPGYDNSRGIMSTYPLQFNTNANKFTMNSLTDMVDVPRGPKPFKAGSQITDNVTGFFITERDGLFKCIRICNITLQNIGKLKDGDPKAIEDIIAQAYFVRAYSHFEAFKLYGPLPYINKALGATDEWDIPRLPVHDMLSLVAADCDSAVVHFRKAGAMRRDGTVDYLNNVNQGVPSGTAAMAYKARVLLYAASPLNNKDNNVEYWKDAVKACAEAINEATINGYKLQIYSMNPKTESDEYLQNYHRYTNEQLWAWSAGKYVYSSSFWQCLLNGVFSQKKDFYNGECQTQNFIDRFETKWGDPLITEADREKARLLGHYNEQDPYSNRDPRLTLDVIYNQTTIPGTWQNGKAQIWRQNAPAPNNYGELRIQVGYALGPPTTTGYYSRKGWGGASYKNGNTAVAAFDPLLRLGELYLSYAEAANEAYGPTVIPAEGTLSAIDAADLVRMRFGLPRSSLPTTQPEFRQKIQNERIIELCMEGHHYFFDIRRWKIAPQTHTAPLMAIDIEKVPVTATYPTGFKYTRIPLEDGRQAKWKDAMYYISLELNSVYKFKNFEVYETW
ncbi:MAG: RagB/SusD family nutrient uptake outer membrane protein [Paludibacter sp.]|nr:RagB/SusD family nutrient uptake outer membrane protein [Paludibacter sp.]